MIAFGPVPSRRLGRSLGINNIPPKVCSYSCVYCQLGRTHNLKIQPRTFYNPEDIYKRVEEKINQAGRAGETIDYLTFVPNGESSLDIHLGKVIEMVKSFGFKVAIITNSSLSWHDSVREYLEGVDWISMKIDSVRESIWRKINRPHRLLKLPRILNGILEFAEQYRGKLVTETMLVRDLNDDQDQISALANFVRQVPNVTSYISIPVRPPAEKWVLPPTEVNLIRSYQILSSKIKNVEYLIGYEGNAFAFTGDMEKDLLSITAVHPMPEEAVIEFLRRAKADRSAVDRLIEMGILVKKEFQGKLFYARKIFPVKSRNGPEVRRE
jgi:wyosine [tRNA(Phe)-imidazoG37] synthetase (radical SAM superfamily)